MPRFGFQRRGVDAPRPQPRVPEHRLLDGDRQRRREERDAARLRHVPVRAAPDLLHSAPADQQADRRQDAAENQPRHAFEPLVPIGMRTVRRPRRDLDARDDDDAAEDVGRRVDGVADHGVGMPDRAGCELECRQQQIACAANDGDARGDRFELSFFRRAGTFFLIHDNFLLNRWFHEIFPPAAHEKIRGTRSNRFRPADRRPLPRRGGPARSPRGRPVQFVP